jgi:hypothetical protein
MQGEIRAPQRMAAALPDRVGRGPGAAVAGSEEASAVGADRSGSRLLRRSRSPAAGGRGDGLEPGRRIRPGRGERAASAGIVGRGKAPERASRPCADDLGLAFALDGQRRVSPRGGPRDPRPPHRPRPEVQRGAGERMTRHAGTSRDVAAQRTRIREVRTATPSGGEPRQAWGGGRGAALRRGRGAALRRGRPAPRTRHRRPARDASPV